MRETWVWSLGWEDPLEKEMATHSSTLAWRIPWREEPGRLQSMVSQRVGHEWATSLTHSVKGFGVVNKAEVDVFLELSFFFYDPMDVGNLILCSSGFSESSLNMWKFTGHILLKPGLENFEHYCASLWDECNCVVVWTFFGIVFFWDWIYPLYVILILSMFLFNGWVNWGLGFPGGSVVKNPFANAGDTSSISG